MTLLEELLDLQVPQEIRISPNAQQVLYVTSHPSQHKKGEHVVQAVWLAETGKAGSARQLTSGTHNDNSVRWFPDGKKIAFLSDRHEHGKKTAVYVLDLSGGEAYPLTSTDDEQPVEAFEISPDGKWIAYLSADEKTPEKKAKEKDKDDVKVWNEDWPYNRLRLLHVGTKKVTTLFNQDAHVTTLAWQDKGNKLAFAAAKNPDLERAYLGIAIFILDVKSESVQLAGRVPSYLANLVYAGDRLYFTGPATSNIDSSSMVYSLDFSESPPPIEQVAHGEEDCAVGLKRVGGDVTVLVQHGMEDQVRILNGKTLFARKQRFFAWDTAFTTDSDEMIVAVATGDSGKPSEVYTTTASGGALIQLSSHGEALGDKKFGKASFFTCRSSDDKEDLDAMFVTPVPHLGPGDTPSSPQPTIVIPHGGPYYRLTDAFDIHFMWAPLLLSNGYSLLVPNYRGGSGRGERFAAYARGGCGIYDHADIITMTQQAVERGLADKKRLVVAGWSQGGFLSYMCAVRNGLQEGIDWKFQAAIPGAGVTDGDVMCFTSDIGTLQGELAGHPPWQMKKDDVSSRSGSAIWEFSDAVEKEGVIPPMLILHGEDDKRVPIEQAHGFRRAMESAGLPFEMAVYPREPHGIKERKHLVDMGERVVRFVDKHIGR